MYQVGDKILYPMHGAGIIKEIEKREILGSVKDYYILHVPRGDLCSNRCPETGIDPDDWKLEQKIPREHGEDQDRQHYAGG